MRQEQLSPEVRKQKIIDYQRAFLSPEGANVLADLSVECNEHRSTFVPGSPDRSAYLEGGRSVILHIRKMVASKPEDVEPETAVTEDEGHA